MEIIKKIEMVIVLKKLVYYCDLNIPIKKENNELWELFKL